MPCALAPSLGEAWSSWSPEVVSLTVHDTTLPLGWASLGNRCPGCVADGRCPRCVAGRPHAYFTISNSDFEFFFLPQNTSYSTSYYVYISGKVLSPFPYPGILSVGIPDTRVSIDGRT